MSYVRGTLTDTESPLERIPPLNGKVALLYVAQPLKLHITARFSDDQHRLGDFEDATDGYIVYDAGIQLAFPIWQLQHQAWLSRIENIFDTEYRQHLSRIKSVMPEPGRNVKLLYRLNF